MRWRLALSILALPLLPISASAAWSARASGPATITADTMTNATGLTAVCTANNNSSTMTVTWTKSTDLYVVSYVLTRSGSVAATYTVAGSTSSFTDTVPTTSGNTYTYTIHAKTQSWVTTESAATTPHGFTGNGNKCV